MPVDDIYKLVLNIISIVCNPALMHTCKQRSDELEDIYVE